MNILADSHEKDLVSLKNLLAQKYNNALFLGYIESYDILQWNGLMEQNDLAG